VLIADLETGEIADPVLVDRISGQPLTEARFGSIPGPAADEGTRKRHAFVARNRGQGDNAVIQPNGGKHE
jgi:hypothetical protein